MEKGSPVLMGYAGFCTFVCKFSGGSQLTKSLGERKTDVTTYFSQNDIFTQF